MAAEIIVEFQTKIFNDLCWGAVYGRPIVVTTHYENSLYGEGMVTSVVRGIRHPETITCFWHPDSVESHGIHFQTVQGYQSVVTKDISEIRAYQLPISGIKVRTWGNPFRHAKGDVAFVEDDIAAREAEGG